ncbi:MAG: crotonase/enoyl-CoA hydratase family protein [Polyangiales bacterium]
MEIADEGLHWGARAHENTTLGRSQEKHDPRATRTLGAALFPTTRETTTMPVAHYRLEGTTAVIQMDDGKANALSDAMITELLAALTKAEAEASAVVLTGRPDKFCAGFDLRVMMSSPEAARTLLKSGSDLLMRLYGSPLPIVAACTGHALAGGALVLLTADVRIGAAGAYRLGLNEVSIGMPVPVLAMELARDRLTTTELGRATLRAQIYGPEEAARAGYLDEVAPAADVLGRATEEATKLGALSRFAYHATKTRLRGRTIAHVLATLDADMASISIGQ